jgi:hypothetical protein
MWNFMLFNVQIYGENISCFGIYGVFKFSNGERAGILAYHTQEYFGIV